MTFTDGNGKKHLRLNKKTKANNKKPRVISMVISVNFTGHQRTKAQTEAISIPFASKTSVADVLAHLKETYPSISFPENAMLITVNEKAASLEHLLESDDQVAFLPYIGGG